MIAPYSTDDMKLAKKILIADDEPNIVAAIQQVRRQA